MAGHHHRFNQITTQVTSARVNMGEHKKNKEMSGSKGKTNIPTSGIAITAVRFMLARSPLQNAMKYPHQAHRVWQMSALFLIFHSILMTVLRLLRKSLVLNKSILFRVYRWESFRSVTGMHRQ